MRLALLIALMATPVQAEPWRTWFVGTNTQGGNHPLTVESKSEASAVSAGTTGKDQNGDEIRLGIHCFSGVRSEPEVLQPEISATIFVDGKLRSVKDVPINLVASFDGGKSVDLGEFGFNQGALIAPLRPQVVALLATYKEMKLWSGNGAISVTFSLENAGAAIADVQCWGDKIQ
ncbi:MAG: hypothetical protein V4586_08100 [Pseudomonadota bacterium]